MTEQAAQAVAIARAWKGTPYVHQSATKDAGCDCLGLIRGVWRQLNGAEPQVIPAYSMDWSEPQGQEALWQAATRHLVAKPKDQAAPGDVLLFRMRQGSVAKHLGLQAQTGPQASFVHAYYRRGVIESPLSAPWARRIVARFEFPEETL